MLVERDHIHRADWKTTEVDVMPLCDLTEYTAQSSLQHHVVGAEKPAVTATSQRGGKGQIDVNPPLPFQLMVGQVTPPTDALFYNIGGIVRGRSVDDDNLDVICRLGEDTVQGFSDESPEIVGRDANGERRRVQPGGPKVLDHRYAEEIARSAILLTVAGRKGVRNAKVFEMRYLR